jgi:hypothetical protein
MVKLSASANFYEDKSEPPTILLQLEGIPAADEEAVDRLAQDYHVIQEKIAGQDGEREYHFNNANDAHNFVNELKEVITIKQDMLDLVELDIDEANNQIQVADEMTKAGNFGLKTPRQDVPMNITRVGDDDVLAKIGPRRLPGEKGAGGGSPGKS